METASAGMTKRRKKFLNSWLGGFKKKEGKRTFLNREKNGNECWDMKSRCRRPWCGCSEAEGGVCKFIVNQHR